LRFQPCHLAQLRFRPRRQARWRMLPWLPGQWRHLINGSVVLLLSGHDNSSALQVQISERAFLTPCQSVDSIEPSRVSTSLERGYLSCRSSLSLVSYRSVSERVKIVRLSCDSFLPADSRV